MTIRPPRWMVWTLVVWLVPFLVLPPSLPAAGSPVTDPARASESRVEKLERGTAERLFRGLKKATEKILAAANRSERVALKLEIAFLDDEERIFLDVRGTVRVRIPTRSWRERLARQIADRRSHVINSNGPVSVDCAVTPLKQEGPEVTFAVQLDLSLHTPQLLRGLVKSAVYSVGLMGVAALAGHATEALASVDTEAAGEAISLGVQEITDLFGAEAGAGAYSAFHDEAQRSLVQQLRPELSGMGLLRHFLLALGIAATKSGASLLGSTLGASLGAALLPGGGSFLLVALTTTAALWFGSWVVTTLTVKLPIYWRLSKIARLHRKAVATSGVRRERRLERYREYVDEVAGIGIRETEAHGKRWSFLELLITWLAERVKDADPDEESFDLAPYRRLVEKLKQRLQFMAVNDDDWYAARMYYQLLGAIDELPDARVEPGR